MGSTTKTRALENQKEEPLMDKAYHSFSDLFKQLGLHSDPQSIESFLKEHRPINASIALFESAIWTSDQSQFLKEQLGKDVDWSEVIDQLGLALQAKIR